MSGHSHYATIKRQKEANDSARGKIFSKYSKEIAIAVREGGGTDPEFNYKLRMVMEKARAANMPKGNIERAVNRGKGGAALETINYEGFGPSGIGVIVETTTDNKNRTSQEIKNIFDRVGGSISGPGSVSYNFENKGLILVKKEGDPQEAVLKLIDLGAEDVEDTEDGIEVYTAPDKLSEVKTKLEAGGFSVISFELFMKPKTMQVIEDPKAAAKILTFLEQLEEHDDVQNVYTNADLPSA